MTRENAALLAPILKAYGDGKTIQFEDDPGDWIDGSEYLFNEDPKRYRIKPEPKLRPWTADEVPVGAIIKGKHNGLAERTMITSVFSLTVTALGQETPMRMTLKELHDWWVCSTDGGKTWKPCGVEVSG